MRSSFAPVSLLAVCLTLPTLASAQRAPLPPAEFALRQPVPLHPAPNPDPEERPELWAAGADYKASFVDGFTFYPALGASAPEHLPLRYRSVAVRSGGSEWALPAGERDAKRGTLECCYVRPGITERYEVRADGLEQSFVVSREAWLGGDLTVVGSFETPLSARHVEAEHTALDFCDGQGRTILRYGAAVAIDAAGRRTAATTSWDGKRLELTVPGTWLADAAWPVTIDPLTGTVYHAAPLYEIASIDVAHDPESHEVVVVYTHIFTAIDYDTRAYLVANDLLSLSNIFSETTTQTTRGARVAFVGGADRWVIAFHRAASATAVSNIFVYQHPRANYTLNAGVTRLIATPSGSFDTRPTVGGSFDPISGTRAFVAWQRDQANGNTATSRVWGAAIDVTQTGTVSASQQFHLDATSGNVDQDLPSINKCSRTGDWIVVWQQYENASTANLWTVEAAVVSASGALIQNFRVGSHPQLHYMRPHIEGESGRYFCTFLGAYYFGSGGAGNGESVLVSNFDWTGTVSRVVAPRPIASSTTKAFASDEGDRPIAFDRKTGSHAVVCTTVIGGGANAYRVGLDCGIAEVSPIETTATVARKACVYNPDRESFVVIEATAGANRLIKGMYFDYTVATATRYGFGCAGRIGCTNGGFAGPLAPPYRGSAEFALTLGSALPSRSYVPCFGASLANIPLGNGCVFALDPNLPTVLVGPVTTNSLGNASLPLPIPSWVTGNLFAQWLVLDGGALKSSDGLVLQVR